MVHICGIRKDQADTAALLLGRNIAPGSRIATFYSSIGRSVASPPPCTVGNSVANSFQLAPISRSRIISPHSHAYLLWGYISGGKVESCKHTGIPLVPEVQFSKTLLSSS